jgi:hypothetical protein
MLRAGNYAAVLSNLSLRFSRGKSSQIGVSTIPGEIRPSMRNVGVITWRLEGAT